jgi:hypothetical protein
LQRTIAEYGGNFASLAKKSIPRADLDDHSCKLLEAFRNKPDGEWTRADFEITASQYAMTLRKLTGTDVVFTRPSIPNYVAIPLKRK